LRRFPIVPGIDLAGVVVESTDPDFAPGDPVLATGWQIGEVHWGGYAQMARLRGDWLVPLPEGLDAERAMAIGTAGFTAMLAVMALEEHGLGTELGDQDGAGTPLAKPAEVCVTGASGGVGSLAVTLLATLGHHVVASTGRVHESDYLHALGAAEIIHRDILAQPPSKGLGAARWAGAVDTVGSTTLATLLATTRIHGSVAACGLAAGADLPTTVYPFILRGVNLLGIDSNYCPAPRRRRAWQRLATLLPRETLATAWRLEPLSRIESLAQDILAGHVRGRVVIDVNA
jgi:acrylyl-CoA reductase (NADPH)